ncbi:MAG: DOPA 4,5-dioxygenase family protein [Thermosynechococcaceae cyanobacterium]
MSESTPEITSFHAHVYYTSSNRETAEQVRHSLGDRFAVQLGQWHDHPIGPHPLPMYQVSFLPHQFAQVVPWLMLHRDDLDILVHPNTGDALADHTDHALWLGEKLPLNLEPLRQSSAF